MPRECPEHGRVRPPTNSGYLEKSQGEQMGSENNGERLTRLFDALEWGDRAKVAGERVLSEVPDFTKFINLLSQPEEPDQKIMQGYLDSQLRMRGEIYFFTMSFTNYLKSLDWLNFNIRLERFTILRDLVRALRNISEHWDQHLLREWLSADLSERSKENYQTFLNKFPNSPAVPFGVSFSNKNDLIIASIVDMKDAIEKILENDSLINEFLKTNFKGVMGVI